MWTLPPAALLRDVTMRDGLQDEVPITTESKLALFEALLSAGVVDLELTSFVRPDRVPAMADAHELAQATAVPGITRWALVLNRKGALRALQAGLTNLQFVVSVSDAHGLRNAGRSAADAVAELALIVADAGALGATVEVTLATAFGCPYVGPVAVAQVVDLARTVAATGVSGIGLADTIGVATPREAAALVAAVLDATAVPVGGHFHDTRGMALANALAALDAGATRLDGGLGGLGGCPFAPGASGNLALEDLAHALEAMGVSTGLSVDALIEAARLASSLVGRSVDSHVGVAGPRFAGEDRP